MFKVNVQWGHLRPALYKTYRTRPHYTFTLKMATAMFVETLVKTQHSTRLTPEKLKLHKDDKVKNVHVISKFWLLKVIYLLVLLISSRTYPRFEIPTGMTMSMLVFATPCGLVGRYQRVSPHGDTTQKTNFVITNLISICYCLQTLAFWNIFKLFVTWRSDSQFEVPDKW
jgi:hypothetical protein